MTICKRCSARAVYADRDGTLVCAACGAEDYADTRAQASPPTPREAALLTAAPTRDRVARKALKVAVRKGEDAAAEHVGVSTYTVRRWRGEMEKQTVPFGIRGVALCQLRKGATAREVSARLNVTPSTIYSWAHRAIKKGALVPLGGSPHKSAAEKAVAVADYLAGKRVKQIAIERGVSPTQIYTWVRRARAAAPVAAAD